MKRDIYALIAEGEHQKQDFKFEISNVRKIARSLSAFSNTDGGRLLVGVKDNGKISGIRTEEEAYMIEAAAGMYCRPSVQVSFTTCRAEGRMVLIAEVEPHENPPVYALDEADKPWAYLRIGDENILAAPVHLSVWRLKKASHGILLHYSPREEELLSLFEHEKKLSFNLCCRLTGLRRKELERLLAQLICLDIVEWTFENQRFLYRLRE